MSIVQQLQRDALDPHVSVTLLLRKAVLRGCSLSSHRRPGTELRREVAEVKALPSTAEAPAEGGAEADGLLVRTARWLEQLLKFRS